MRIRRSKKVFLYLQKADKEAMELIAAQMDMRLPDLLRCCIMEAIPVLTSHVRGDDLYHLVNMACETRRCAAAIADTVKRDKTADSDLISEILKLGNGVFLKASYVYENYDNIRRRIGRQAIQMRINMHMRQSGAHPEGKGTSIVLSLSSDEYSALQKLAAKENGNVSAAVRKCVFRNCLGRDLFVDSYPLDDVTEAFCKDLLPLKGIAQLCREKKEKITFYDVETAILYLKNLNTLLLKVQRIPPEQNEIRKEARRIASGEPVRRKRRKNCDSMFMIQRSA